MKALIKILLTIIATAFLTLSVHAQNGLVGRMLQVIKDHQQQDTFRVNRLNEFANSSSATLGQITRFAEEALSISEKISYTNGKAYALMNLGFASGVSGTREKALTMLDEADSFASATANEDLHMNVLCARSYCWRRYDNKKALNYGLQAEALAIKLGNKGMLSKQQMNIAQVYSFSFSDYSKGVEYALKAINAAEASANPLFKTDPFSVLSQTYLLMGDYDKAFIYAQKVLELNKQLGSAYVQWDGIFQMASILHYQKKYNESNKYYQQIIQLDTSASAVQAIQSSMAENYLSASSLDSALWYAFQSLGTAKKIHEDEGIEFLDALIAEGYIKKQMSDSAIVYAKEGLANAKQTGSLENARKNASVLTEAYAAKKDYENAYAYNVVANNYKDSILNTGVKK